MKGINETELRTTILKDLIELPDKISETTFRLVDYKREKEELKLILDLEFASTEQTVTEELTEEGKRKYSNPLKRQVEVNNRLNNLGSYLPKKEELKALTATIRTESAGLEFMVNRFKAARAIAYLIGDTK